MASATTSRSSLLIPLQPGSRCSTHQACSGGSNGGPATEARSDSCAGSRSARWPKQAGSGRIRTQSSSPTSSSEPSPKEPWSSPQAPILPPPPARSQPPARRSSQGSRAAELGLCTLGNGRCLELGHVARRRADLKSGRQVEDGVETVWLCDLVSAVDRKSVVWGQRGAVRVELGGRRYN